MGSHFPGSTAEKTTPIRPLPAHHTMKADNHTTPTAPQRYDKVARSLHALMLVLFIIMFGTAIGWNLDDSLKRVLIPFHKGVGILVMMLACFRLMWAWINSEHRPPVALPARIGHAAMYVLMLAVPIIGLICQAGQAKGAGTSNVSMPWTIELGNAWHGELGFTLLVLIIGHAGMAVLHQLKGEKILQRMW